MRVRCVLSRIRTRLRQCIAEDLQGLVVRPYRESECGQGRAAADSVSPQYGSRWEDLLMGNSQVRLSLAGIYGAVHGGPYVGHFGKLRQSAIAVDCV